LPAGFFGRFSKGSLGLGILVFAIAMAAAAVFTARQHPLYRATATQVVAPTSAVMDTGDILRSLETLERRTVIATFARIPTAPRAQQEAAGALGLPPGLDEFRVEASVLPSTNILRIDVVGPDPSRAAALANALAAHTREEVQSLYRIFTLRPLDDASPPARPFHPEPRRNYAVAACLGLFAAVATVLLVDHLRARGVRAG
jgi:capsular polysaccharide biosynthesis protein